MSEKTVQKPADSEVTKRTAFDPQDLRAISSFDDAMRLLADNGVDVVDASTEIGDGFEMCDDKGLLIKKPFVILSWAFALGDFGEEYSIMRIVTDDGKRLVVTDGGTGVCAQLKDYETRTGRTGAMIVQRGLRKSEYDNEFGHGITYYLNV